MQKSKLQFKIQNYFKSFKFLVVFFSFSLLIFILIPAKPVIAAEFFFKAEREEIGIGDEVRIDLLFSSNENINAFEGKLTFSSNLFDLKDIQEGNTIINLWIERPQAIENQIIFSGITPGGFKGENGLIFSVFFRAKKAGTAVLNIDQAAALLHDGIGTEAELSVTDFNLLIKEDVEVIPVDRAIDTTPPEPFFPQVARDPNLFDGKWFLVFATQDKDSGIDYYAVHESRQKKDVARISVKNWTEAESPYLLKDQELRSYIFVKAVDKAGNERIAVVQPEYPLSWYEIWWIWGIIIIVILFVIFLIKKGEEGKKIILNKKTEINNFPRL